MDDTPRRHSRRSHPNLQMLSVTPLTPNFPLPATVEDSSGPASSNPQLTIKTAPKSYIEPRSLPQTPSILSRSNSRTRQRPTSQHSAVAISDFTDTLEYNALSPIHAKRSSHGQSHHSRSNSAKAPRPSDSTGWLLQTASTLTMSTAESKGQAWLATRTSSTSLADAAMPIERLETYTADDEFSPVSYRRASRSQSRFNSRATSRRGSRVGIMTPVGFKTPGEKDEDTISYFEGLGPDFVDLVDEEVIIEDDGEMKRVVWGRVGGWVDWAVGWMDFRENMEDEDEGDEGQDGAETSKQPRRGPTGKATVILDPPRKAKRVQNQSTEKLADIPPAPQNNGVMGDAAWLFSLAKNSLS